MIFLHTWQAAIDGRKTQTRRIVKTGDGFTTPLAMVAIGKDAGRVIHTIPNCTNPGPRFNNIYSVCNGKRTVYAVGQTYAMQPGRGKPAIIYCPDHPCYGIDVIEPGSSSYAAAKDGSWPYKGQGYIDARIRITNIRREDVRTISEEDVKAEGFENFTHFIATWIHMHDRSFEKISQDMSIWCVEDILRVFLKDRPAERYQAWVLTFELV